VSTVGTHGLRNLNSRDKSSFCLNAAKDGFRRGVESSARTCGSSCLRSCAAEAGGMGIRVVGRRRTAARPGPDDAGEADLDFCYDEVGWLGN
jgi:hypothetical protein